MQRALEMSEPVTSPDVDAIATVLRRSIDTAFQVPTADAAPEELPIVSHAKRSRGRLRASLRPAARRQPREAVEFDVGRGKKGGEAQNVRPLS
jgi:hypothetical protein